MFGRDKISEFEKLNYEFKGVCLDYNVFRAKGEIKSLKNKKTVIALSKDKNIDRNLGFYVLPAKVELTKDEMVYMNENIQKGWEIEYVKRIKLMPQGLVIGGRKDSPLKDYVFRKLIIDHFLDFEFKS